MNSLAPLEVLGPKVQSVEFTADTLVIVGHRGGPAIVEQFDGVKWRIPSRQEADREHLLRYDVALSLRRRAVVPGTRDIHSGRGGQPIKQQSFLYIRPTTQDGRTVPDADRLEWCRPFTADEIARFRIGGEAVARPAGDVAVVPVSDVQATLISQGVDIEASVEAKPDGAVLAPIPADQHAGIQESRALAGDTGDGISTGRRRR